MERIKGYLEYKLDLELCGVNTFEKDDKIRERYEQYLKDKQQDIKTNSKKDNKEDWKDIKLIKSFNLNQLCSYFDWQYKQITDEEAKNYD